MVVICKKVNVNSDKTINHWISIKKAAFEKSYYILLYNNRRIHGEMLFYQQIPNLVSIILCALGKGGGKDNEDTL